jgi:hypothetical protein
MSSGFILNKNISFRKKQMQLMQILPQVHTDAAAVVIIGILRGDRMEINCCNWSCEQNLAVCFFYNKFQSQFYGSTSE